MDLFPEYVAAQERAVVPVPFAAQVQIVVLVPVVTQELAAAPL